MENTRQSILDHASRLSVAQGEVPSLNALATAAGISKGGLIHHFPSRDSLLTALAEQGIAEVDTALEHAASRGDLLQTWLELSLPDQQGVALFQSLAAVFFAGRSDHTAIQELVSEANQRWEILLQRELGSATAARAARLLGDGLLLGAISGTISASDASSYLRAAQDAVYALAEAKR